MSEHIAHDEIRRVDDSVHKIGLVIVSTARNGAPRQRGKNWLTQSVHV